VVDVVIILFTIAAVAHGLWLGAVTQLFSFGGLCAGLVAGAAAAPLAARLGGDPTAKALLALASLAAGPIVLGGLGRHFGIRLSAGLREGKLGRVDAAIGAVVAGGASLLASWLVASLVATAAARPVAAAVQRSVVVRTLDRVLPPAPTVFARLDRLVAAGGFPQVFAELEPEPASRQPLPPGSVVQAAATRVAGAVVKIAGRACGGIQEGSGFVAGPELVVTNAHVVAGVQRPVVIDGAGRHPATALLFDPDTDIAVLRTADLAGSPLVLDPDTAGPGAGGAVLGYPGGGPLDVEPAVVLARFEAIGRDIYGRALIARQVYQLQSRIRPGNSGGPFVDAEGRVVGVVFSRSLLRDDIGFALTAPEVANRLQRARAASRPVGTGPCMAG
jgi:S1-C subfamily serine protease